MKKVVTLFFAILFYVNSNGQDTIGNWILDGMGSVTLNQVSRLNWNIGGTNSVGLGGLINFNPTYSKRKHLWKSTINLIYGFQLIGKGNSAVYQKTDDNIIISTLYGFRIRKYWNIGTLFTFRSQFSPGYDYPNDTVLLSTFMSPGYLLGGIGFDYIPCSWFSLYLSPFTVKYTFVLNDTLSKQGLLGLDPGKKVAQEFGFFIRATLKKDIFKNVNISTTLDLNTDNYTNFGVIDVNWDFLLTGTINSWLSVSLIMQLIYDDDVTIKSEAGHPLGPRIQFDEILGLGLSYTIHRKGAKY
jgi:hypothetical protein